MKQSEHLQNQAKALISFGSQLSSTGLTYLEANAYQEKINEADRVAKEKVLKEELTKAEILGRQIAARNPNMSVMEEVIALKENVGLTMENPNYQKIMEAMNEGFLLKRAEVGLASYNAEIKNNADSLGEEIYELFLEDQKPKTITGPAGQTVQQEGFQGNLTQYAAEHIENLRVATISNLVNDKDKENRFGTVLAKPGNRINYDSVKAAIAKKQIELDDQERYNSSFDDVQEDIHQIVISGRSRSNHPKDKHLLGTPRLSGKSLSRIIQSLKDKGLGKKDTNRIIFTSLRSGLETEVEKHDVNILNTNYFSNLIELLHDKTTDPKDGLSLYMKDPQAGNQLIEQINKKRSALQTKFDAQTNKRTKSRENVLAGNATVSLGTAIANASKMTTKGPIRELITEIMTLQGPGEEYEGMQHMDNNISNTLINYLQKLHDEAEEDDPPVSEDQIEKVLGEANLNVSGIINKLSETKLNQINPRSTDEQFSTQLTNLDNYLEALQGINKSVASELGYGWTGEQGFKTEIQSAIKQVRDKKKDILQKQVEGADLTTTDGVYKKFNLDNINYGEEKVTKLNVSDPVIAKLLNDADELTNSVDDNTKFIEMFDELKDHLNQTITKPVLNRTQDKILYEEVHLYPQTARERIYGNWMALQERRSKEVNGKIVVNQTVERSFELQMEENMNNLATSNEGVTLEEQVNQLQGWIVQNREAWSEGKIGQPAFGRIKKMLNAGITSKKSIIDQRYGQLKVFNDSKKSIQRYVLGESESGIDIKTLGSSHHHLFEEMRLEHRHLQDHLIELSENFPKKIIKSDDPSIPDKKIPQAGMFLTGTSYHNKAIREKAFLLHRRLMWGDLTQKEVEQIADKMKGEGKWSDEEISVIEAVASFESKPRALETLVKSFNTLVIASNSKVGKDMAQLQFIEGENEEVIEEDKNTNANVNSLLKYIDRSSENEEVGDYVEEEVIEVKSDIIEKSKEKPKETEEPESTLGPVQIYE